MVLIKFKKGRKDSSTTPLPKKLLFTILTKYNYHNDYFKLKKKN